jgi:hypothetical protein
VISRFPKFAFKFNLYRYAQGKIAGLATAKTELQEQLSATTQRLELAVSQADSAKVGRCTS